MPIYDIACKECNFEITWNCSIAEYNKQINYPCPKCSGTLFQKMNHAFRFFLRGHGWSGRGQGIKGSGYYKKGSQEDLDDALRENDFLAEQPKKNDAWKRSEENRKKIEKKISE